MKTILFLLSALITLLASCSSDVNVALEKSPTAPFKAPATFEDTEDRDPELANPFALDPIWYWDPANPSR